MLREGATIEEICQRLGVDQRSWYRYVHRMARPARVRRKRRRANAISAQLERSILELEAEGLPRVVIAERLGVHANTVSKYLLRAGRPAAPRRA
jgi:DNA-binding CsgD family transcriptional regulator